jgi:hypothetical protein
VNRVHRPTHSEFQNIFLCLFLLGICIYVKIVLFAGISKCRMVKTYENFKGTCCLHHEVGKGGCIEQADCSAASHYFHLLSSSTRYLRLLQMGNNSSRCNCTKNRITKQMKFKDYSQNPRVYTLLTYLLRGLSPQANYTDLATSACRRS